nr:uncharacterized protein LOC109120019 [Solanum lycopersicum]
MPTRRANARNVNARNANVTPPIPNHNVSNVEFRNAIQMISPPKFIGSYTSEDIHNFLDEIKNIFEVMQVNGNNWVEFISYRAKDVAHISYTQWKENKAIDAAYITWDCLSEIFLDRFFPIDLIEVKAQEFMNIRQRNMMVQEHGLKFNELYRCIAHMVANSSA